MKKENRIGIVAVAFLMLLLTACGGGSNSSENSEYLTAYQEKAGLLRERAITEDVLWELGDTPAGDVGHAMYMECPQQILGTFMVRHDGYRVRIDDVQHNIGGYYLYWKNYDKLVEYGMPK